MSKQRLIPKNGFVILKPIEVTEETYGNIILPDLGKERPEMGEIVSISKQYNYHSDTFIDSNLKVGEVALIPKLGAQRIVIDGQDYFITRETEILATIEKE
jgi:chaperonin GroES